MPRVRRQQEPVSITMVHCSQNNLYLKPLGYFGLVRLAEIRSVSLSYEPPETRSWVRNGDHNVSSNARNFDPRQNDYKRWAAVIVQLITCRNFPPCLGSSRNKPSVSRLILGRRIPARRRYSVGDGKLQIERRLLIIATRPASNGAYPIGFLYVGSALSVCPQQTHFELRKTAGENAAQSPLNRRKSHELN